MKAKPTFIAPRARRFARHAAEMVNRAMWLLLIHRRIRDLLARFESLLTAWQSGVLPPGQAVPSTQANRAPHSATPPAQPHARHARAAATDRHPPLSFCGHDNRACHRRVATVRTPEDFTWRRRDGETQQNRFPFLLSVSPSPCESCLICPTQLKNAYRPQSHSTPILLRYHNK